MNPVASSGLTTQMRGLFAVLLILGIWSSSRLVQRIRSAQSWLRIGAARARRLGSKWHYTLLGVTLPGGRVVPFSDLLQAGLPAKIRKRFENLSNSSYLGRWKTWGLE